MAANNRMMDSTARLELHVFACITKCLYAYCIPWTTAVLDHIINNTLIVVVVYLLTNYSLCSKKMLLFLERREYHSDVGTIIEFESFSAQFTCLYTPLIYSREGRQQLLLAIFCK